MTIMAFVSGAGPDKAETIETPAEYQSTVGVPHLAMKFQVFDAVIS